MATVTTVRERKTNRNNLDHYHQPERNVKGNSKLFFDLDVLHTLHISKQRKTRKTNGQNCFLRMTFFKFDKNKIMNLV